MDCHVCTLLFYVTKQGFRSAVIAAVVHVPSLDVVIVSEEEH